MHAFQYTHGKVAVGKGQPEETGFEFTVSRLVLNGLTLTFQRSLSLLSGTPFFYEAVVSSLQVCGANILRVVGILAEMAEQVDVIAPNGSVR